MIGDNDEKNSIESQESGRESFGQNADTLTEDCDLSDLSDRSSLLKADIESLQSTPRVRGVRSSISSGYCQERDDVSSSGSLLSDEWSYGGITFCDTEPMIKCQSALPTKQIDTGYRPMYRNSSFAKIPRKMSAVKKKYRTSVWVSKTMNIHRMKEFSDSCSIKRNGYLPPYEGLEFGNSSTVENTLKPKSPTQEDLGTRYREHTLWRAISSNLEASYREGDPSTFAIDIIENQLMNSKGFSRSGSLTKENIDEETQQGISNRDSSLSTMDGVSFERKNSLQLQVGRMLMHGSRQRALKPLVTRRSGFLWKHTPQRPSTQCTSTGISGKPWR